LLAVENSAGWNFQRAQQVLLPTTEAYLLAEYGDWGIRKGTKPSNLTTLLFNEFKGSAPDE